KVKSRVGIIRPLLQRHLKLRDRFARTAQRRKRAAEQVTRLRLVRIESHGRRKDWFGLRRIQPRQHQGAELEVRKEIVGYFARRWRVSASSSCRRGSPGPRGNT